MRAVRTTLRTWLCRIRAERNDRDCPLPASLQLSCQSDVACQVVYKTAAPFTDSCRHLELLVRCPPVIKTSAAGSLAGDATRRRRTRTGPRRSRDRRPRRTQAVSDSGSRMGAAGRCQTRAEAVTVHSWMPLTCGNVAYQRLCRGVRSVRIEGVRGSNPLSSTEWSSRFSGDHFHVWV